MRDPPGPSESPLLATRERSSRADHFVVLRACHAQGTRAEHLVRVPQTYEMSAEAMSCWECAPLKLNTANCGPGRGKMQVSFSHVGSGGARKTPPLSLGTWPTEGPGHEEALRWYMNVQSKLHPLRGKVGPTDVRVQQLMLECRQAAKDACALPRTAEVCLLRTSAVGALCSAYPRAILSLPSNPFPSRSRRRRRRGCRRWRAWRRFGSWPLPSCHWWPAPPHAARGDAGGGPAHLPHSLLSNPFLSPRCAAAAACRQGDGKQGKEAEQGPGTAPPGPPAKVESDLEVAWAILGLSSAYPQPTLPLILSHPARGDGGRGGDAAAGELGG
jgi:hypothetical protein